MNRAQMIGSLDDLISMVKDSNKSGKEPVFFIPPCSEISQEEMAENEYDKLGFFVSFHPLDNYRIKLSELPAISDLENYISGQTVSLGGLVMDAKERTTKKGNKMAVFTLEDLSGRVEVVVFGRTFHDFKEYLGIKNPAVQISGKLDIQEREMDDGEVIKTPKIVLNSIRSLEESKKIDKIVLNLTAQDDLHGIKGLLTNHPGDIKIVLEYELVQFKVDYSLIQDTEILKKLGNLCHYETYMASTS